VRRGGIAGIALEAEVDTSQLPESDAARVESALSELPWGRHTTAPQHPDQFRYDFVLDDDRSAVLREDEIPLDLQPVLEQVAKHGNIRPGSS
jgi:hypothetical protein